MTGVAVVEVPEWQGPPAPNARRPAAAARALADLLPEWRRVRPRVDERTGGPAATGGDRGLGVLAAVRAALHDVAEPVVVTVGGHRGLELAPIERAHRRYGDRLAVVWFDAHPALNTPACAPPGALHGMVLRTLLGEGPAALRPNRPLDPRRLVLAGVRPLDPAERRFAADHGIHHLDVAEPAAPTALIDAVAATGADTVYVHADLDVLAPAAFGPAGLPRSGGLPPHRLARNVRALGERFTLAGAGITGHLPGAGPEPGGTAVLEPLARALSDIAGEIAPEDVQRIERHAVAAWPAPVSRELSGWLARHTPGMRRLRSGNTALPPAADGDPRAGLPAVEAFYRARGLPVAVQVSPAARHIDLDEHLAARGYRMDTPVHVLTADARAVAHEGEPGPGWAVTVDGALTAAWLAAFVELDGQPDSREIAEQVIARITLPAAFTTVVAADGRAAGIGLVVGGDEHWAGVYCMATHPGHRRRGVAAATLRAAARWAAGHGATGLYLQVARANPAARRLYARAGFGYAYGYHYRLRGSGDGRSSG
ncbi:GNAT family N-acetyltransferase [Marinactinospora rubrisoli]|uniref:GNAT family N-acetyltransferase n=1 Tax=Marinactinospora rubrisoli TaxID=2715399 RepID=A0ABW2KNV8_9ACTN